MLSSVVHGVKEVCIAHVLRTDFMDLARIVDGVSVAFVDDVIAGGSIYKQTRALADAGSEPCHVVATHGVLVGKAMQLLADPNIREVVVTNTVPVPESKRTELPKLRVLSIAPLLASAIDNIFKCQSVSKVFLDEAVDFAV